MATIRPCQPTLSSQASSRNAEPATLLRELTVTDITLRIKENSLMTIFVFQGSKGGTGRTASSVILATGIAALGLNPLHLQLTLAGIRPVIAGAENVPFSTAWLPEEVATPDAIRGVIAAHRECQSVVVIDMTRRPIWDFGLKDRKTVTLFPMRRKPSEVEKAIGDYRDHCLYAGEDEAPAYLMPIAWPHQSSEEMSLKITMFDRDGGSAPPPSILMPGIPMLPEEELHDLINATAFKCSQAVHDAAVEIARAAVRIERN